MRRALFYVRSAVDFDEYRIHLKSVPCPHCRAVGHLNRHGYLRGYAQRGAERIVRGWRVFCSNRGRHRGCGRTHSILLADFIRRRSVTAPQFWKFLESILQGLNVSRAWESVYSIFTVECGYRLWMALGRFQSTLRALLCRQGEPPELTVKNPKLQTLEHLRALFAAESSPISAWQLAFQRAFAA